jgi:hypothetical protein
MTVALLMNTFITEEMETNHTDMISTGTMGVVPRSQAGVHRDKVDVSHLALEGHRPRWTKGLPAPFHMVGQAPHTTTRVITKGVIQVLMNMLLHVNTVRMTPLPTMTL